MTQVSGETATGSQQATFDAMNLFLGLMTDPFVAGRGDGFGGNAGAAPSPTESASAYARASGRVARATPSPNSRPRRVASDDLFDPALERVGRGLWRQQTTDGNPALGSNSATARAFGFAAGADYRISPATLAGFALAGGGTSFAVNGFG